jgi:hypothetical protein
MKAEHGDQVRRGEGHRRQAIEIRPIRGVEVEVRHRLGEERGMHQRGHSAAILVRLDRHHGRFGAPAQARYRPGVGVGFLELVAGPMDRDFSGVETRAVLEQPS